MEVLGIRLVGVNAENGQKLLLTVAFFAVVLLLRRGLHAAARRRWPAGATEQARFWTRQAINVATTLLLVLGLLSLWFDDPTRLATALGLVTAGLAFALQRVVTAVAGYFVILRGTTFAVGDRITMGGVRGDVIGLGFIQTTIMEMGQPPAVQGADPAMWVRSRQYTGRVVTVSNDKIFDEPVYNYTRDFPYIWDELTLPIGYRADRARVERILLGAAERHTVAVREESRRALDAMQQRYMVQSASVEPTVYYRLTDNWLELSLRFVTEVRGGRDVKDTMSREILRDLDAAGIGLASATFEIVGLPPLRMQNSGAVRERD
ncbi:MAG: mechanosensitive ion channel [Chloroflexia bacterium]|nr:mechanosensitive ion channel [Chloroflexia bacterium]